MEAIKEQIKEQIKIKSYLSFTLGEEVFAANVSKVINILEMCKVTKVPKSPDYMKGVINLRGMVLPLVDTRNKFGMPETEYTSNTCILVLEVEVESDASTPLSTQKVKVGAIVDSVREVLEIDDSSLQDSPSIGTRYESEFIDSMYRKPDSEEFIMILDMDKIFSEGEVAFLKSHENVAD